jgi:hypothetical protein
MSAFGDFTVTRASSKRVLGSAGTLVTYGNNEPAFEFNADGTYRGVSVEPGATNLLMRCSDFEHPNFTKTGCTAVNTTDPVVGPCSLITEDTGTSEHSVARNADIFALNDVNRSIELAIKNVSGARYVNINSTASGSITGNTAGRISFSFDLETGTVTFSNTNTTIVDVRQLPGGWWRISGYTTVTADGAAGRRWRFNFLGGNNTNESYTGTGKQVLIAFGGAYLNKPYLQSPILTEGSTVTRVADSITLTGASSLIGQTQGALAVSFRTINASTSRVIATLFEDADNYIRLRLTTGNTLIAEVRTGGVDQVSIESGALTSNTKYGAALSYANNSVFLSLDGAQVGSTDTSATIPACSKQNLGQDNAGANQLNGNLSSVVNYATALSIADANALSLSLKSL